MAINVTVIVPAFNEAENIKALVNMIFELYPNYEVIVIDDGSKDNTATEAMNAGAAVFSHPYNMGNGAAIKSGIRKASGDILVFMDGDNQHNPGDIAELIKYFPQYDMVIGARKKGGQASLFRNVGNKIFNRFASYVAKFPVEDLTSGFRAVRSGIAKNLLYMLPNAYSYPTTMTLAVLRSGLSIKYIPIETKKREIGKSKIRLFRDGVRFLMIIIKICTLYSPMRVFLPVSFLMFLLGLARYIYTFVTIRAFTNMSALLFISSVIIFMIGLVSEQICQMRYEKIEGE